MNMEFTNAAFDAAGTALEPEQPIEYAPSPTNPATAGGAGQKAKEHPACSASSDNSPTGERDVPRIQRNPHADSTSRDNPAATPGEQARKREKPTVHQPVPNNPPCGAGDDASREKEPRPPKHHPTNPASAGGGGHMDREIQAPKAAAQVSASDGGGDAPGLRSEPLTTSVSPTKSRRKAGEVVADQMKTEDLSVLERPDLRFSDPLVAEIVQLHRMRRRWMKAKNALTMQGKAIGRAACDGDKKAGSAAFDRVKNGKAKPEDADLEIALLPFIAAIAHFDKSVRPIERELEKLAKRLPIAPWAKTVTGLGWGSIAAIVGEAGDLSQYPSVAGVWKRMGLAVIDGDGRQRKVANADAALIHGYSPERRSVVWVMADSMSKHQRTWLDKETGEVRKPAGVYGDVLEREKEKALAAGCNKVHAERRGKRHMSKAVLKDMTLAWRRAVGRQTDQGALS